MNSHGSFEPVLSPSSITQQRLLDDLTIISIEAKANHTKDLSPTRMFYFEALTNVRRALICPKSEPPSTQCYSVRGAVVWFYLSALVSDNRVHLRMYF